ncbi:MAG: helix-turn-helix domain-containing protein [Pseudomonadales bacterium]|jgi:AraC family transcriptional regulator of adaptative response / DNA-3-methyladenine glycosylase II|nr:helix-turn-helix domain-containing protein [Pseudomonadales bacterium]
MNTARTEAAHATTPLDNGACYRALKTHDARFDGQFFTAVTSTGIYCRPVCRVRLPRRENCRFFRHAAQAEAAGFRPCLRCRPELAPRSACWSTEDASQILALQAARLIDTPDAWSHQSPSAAQLAVRLGVSDRHLRRVFEREFGVAPLQYLQTRRLLAAKQLLVDTRLPMTQVALASGFASVRRFNAAFVAHYGLNPGALRRNTGAAAHRDHVTESRLSYRPPYDITAMLDFLERRAIEGVEALTHDAQGHRCYLRTLQISRGNHTCIGTLRAHFDEVRQQLVLRVDDALTPLLPVVIARVRALFDLDADPVAVNTQLRGRFPGSDGLRVPGTVDGFELAVRAVLGQQITVAAARTLALRLVRAFGEPLPPTQGALTHLFPTPAAIADASDEALGRLGIVRQRQAALRTLARAMHAGQLELHTGVALDATLDALRALPGIGDWTAQYIAMRALRWPDAFPAGDIALQKALNVHGAKEAERASQPWRPWRSYAVLRAWHSAAPGR